MCCNEFNHKLPNVAIASFLCCFSFPALSIEMHDGIGVTVKQKKVPRKNVRENCNQECSTICIEAGSLFSIEGRYIIAIINFKRF